MMATEKIGRKEKVGSLFVCLLCLLYNCTPPLETVASISPTHFNVQVAFQSDLKGININTSWNTGKKQFRLYLDNHAPSWINNAILYGNSSFSRPTDLLYNTKTADGKQIQGEVYVCDSLGIGGLVFKNVLFYNISNKATAGKPDGSLGENIMSRAIWKIDFNKHLITIASEPDSIKEMQNAFRLPVLFTGNKIEIETVLGNNSKQKIELDLGYNGNIILPAAAFGTAISPGKNTFTEEHVFSTPAGTETTRDITAADNIQLNHRLFHTTISTNKLVKEKLIGLGFFSQFEFLIIDYLHKAVYIPPKKIPRS